MTAESDNKGNEVAKGLRSFGLSVRIRSLSINLLRMFSTLAVFGPTFKNDSRKHLQRTIRVKTLEFGAIYIAKPQDGAGAKQLKPWPLGGEKNQIKQTVQGASMTSIII
jgi:hypothetical protein